MRDKNALESLLANTGIIQVISILGTYRNNINIINCHSTQVTNLFITLFLIQTEDFIIFYSLRHQIKMLKVAFFNAALLFCSGLLGNLYIVIHLICHN